MGILKQRWRAITTDDFELLANSVPTYNIARAKCVPERDLTASDPETVRTGHVSIIVVPDSSEAQPKPTSDCVDAIAALLDERRLITSRHHVLGPQYTSIRIEADIASAARFGKETVLDNINKKLIDFFHPLTGGPPESDQKGWPFGRDVYISEVYHILEGVEGVDYVTSVALFYKRNANDDWNLSIGSIPIAPRNLVHFDLRASSITVR
jgi:predicted phage baseplate assembly protein